MLSKINIVGGGFKNPVTVMPDNPERKSWISVFLGENGSKKSLLLRIICEAALGRSRYVLSGRKVIGISEAFSPDNLPKRVIAISGTPLDRFPRAGTTNLNRKRKGNHFNATFRYLGQRAANGMSGVAQSERSLIGSLVANRVYFKKRKHVLEKVFENLGLEPSVGVKVRLASKRENYLVEQLMDFRTKTELEGTLKKALEESYIFRDEESDIARQFYLQGTLKDLVGGRSLSELKEILVFFEKPQLALRLSLDRVAARPKTFSVAEWELLIRLGVVEIDGTEFRRKSKAHGVSAYNKISGEALSSGQWSWLNGFLGLGVELRENSLVLIDEPENSLHPKWQQRYLPMLEEVLAVVESCQVIVATHSPLIASGLSPRCGNLRMLRKQNLRNSADSLVSSDECESTFGWTATDVYEETFGIEPRAPKFTYNADKALELIRENERLTAERFNSLAESLEEDMAVLPVLDPMRDVISGIIRSLRQLTGVRKAKL